MADYFSLADFSDFEDIKIIVNQTMVGNDFFYAKDQTYIVPFVLGNNLINSGLAEQVIEQMTEEEERIVEPIEKKKGKKVKGK